MNTPNWPVPKLKPDEIDLRGWVPIFLVLAVWWGTEWLVGIL